jgi:L-serine dehydratase
MKNNANISSNNSAPLAGLADMFKIGIGPSSSHTMGPMKAANLFLTRHKMNLKTIKSLRATLYGSLAFTGRGHETDKAIVLGFSGMTPVNCDPDRSARLFDKINTEKKINLLDDHIINFDPKTDIVFNVKERYTQHPNTMRFEAFDGDLKTLANELWFSIGGGFVHRDGETTDTDTSCELPYPFRKAADFLALDEKLSLAAMALANEDARRPRHETLTLIDQLKETMLNCIKRGLEQTGELPGGLKVKRRARALYAKLEAEALKNSRLPNWAMDYVSAFAIAVNEENAAGGRVVTAPTNGAAGVVPAVLRYYIDFCPTAQSEGIQAFFLVAATIGAIIKNNSSISGAEVGCQGEVGSAAAMAAAGLTAALGGTNAQIENAAEIAMEHHLGMTCDPVGGLVQIPCIERNAFGAVKAINAASLALHGDGQHRISLDHAIETMRQTGHDMQSKYKETSQGGLAVNATEC